MAGGSIPKLVLQYRMVPPQTDTPQPQSGKCVYRHAPTAHPHELDDRNDRGRLPPTTARHAHTHATRVKHRGFLQTGGIAWTRFAISRSQCAVACLSSECSPAHHGASWPNTDMRIGSQQMLYTISTIPGTDGARLSALPPRMSHRRSGGEPCLRDECGRDRHFTSSACA